MRRKNMPKKLGKEPLVEAVFELRFSSNVPASNVLPGFFLKEQAVQGFEPLPTSEIPKHLREQDPKLKYAPLIRIHYEKFSISLGDKNLAVIIKLPYPGWQEFKKCILSTLRITQKSGIVDSLERYSLKYINILEAPSQKEQMNLINSSLSIGGHKLEGDRFSFRVEIEKSSHIHIVTTALPAMATLPDGASKSGIVVDVDSICQLPENISFPSLIKEASSSIENLHTENKSLFFDCLKSETIESLEPTYD